MKKKFWTSTNARKFFDVEHELRTTLAHKYIVNRLAELKPQNILDYGCGEGDLTIRIAKAGLNVVGCDISKESLQSAKDISSKKNASINYETVEDVLNGQKGEFDCIIISFVLVTISTHENAVAMMANIFSLLSDNGIVILVDTHPCFRDKRYSSFETEFCNDNYSSIYEPFKVTVFDGTNSKKKSSFNDFHKTLSEIFLLFQKTHLVISNLTELYDSVDCKISSRFSMKRHNLSVPPYIYLEGKKDGNTEIIK